MNPLPNCLPGLQTWQDQDFNFAFGEYIQPGTISMWGPVFFLALVIYTYNSVSKIHVITVMDNYGESHVRG